MNPLEFHMVDGTHLAIRGDQITAILSAKNGTTSIFDKRGNDYEVKEPYSAVLRKWRVPEPNPQGFHAVGVGLGAIAIEEAPAEPNKRVGSPCPACGEQLEYGTLHRHTCAVGKEHVGDPIKPAGIKEGLERKGYGWVSFTDPAGERWQYRPDEIKSFHVYGTSGPDMQDWRRMVEVWAEQVDVKDPHGLPIKRVHRVQTTLADFAKLIDKAKRELAEEKAEAAGNTAGDVPKEFGMHHFPGKEPTLRDVMQTLTMFAAKLGDVVGTQLAMSKHFAEYTSTTTTGAESLWERLDKISEAIEKLQYQEFKVHEIHQRFTTIEGAMNDLQRMLIDDSRRMKADIGALLNGITVANTRINDLAAPDDEYKAALTMIEATAARTQHLAEIFGFAHDDMAWRDTPTMFVRMEALQRTLEHLKEGDLPEAFKAQHARHDATAALADAIVKMLQPAAKTIQQLAASVPKVDGWMSDVDEALEDIEERVMTVEATTDRIDERTAKMRSVDKLPKVRAKAKRK